MANEIGTSPSYAVATSVAVQNSNNARSQNPNTFMVENQPGVREEENKIDYDTDHVSQKDMAVPTSYINLPYDYKGSNITDSNKNNSDNNSYGEEYGK
mmetsp:Transcript_22747/g.25286  ORF Transcript_22747/g.25286 Transcript_22747/m.25286 type:complete len:98 (+) Transcript_22747:132-425(+)